MPGYPTHIFVDNPVDPSLVCPICQDILKEAVSICEEGHTYCRDCAVGPNERQRIHNCPECRADIVTLHKVRSTNVAIEALETKCGATCLETRTCDWTGPPREREEHVKDCPVVLKEKLWRLERDIESKEKEHSELTKKVWSLEHDIESREKRHLELADSMLRMWAKQNICDVRFTSPRGRRLRAPNEASEPDGEVALPNFVVTVAVGIAGTSIVPDPPVDEFQVRLCHKETWEKAESRILSRAPTGWGSPWEAKYAYDIMPKLAKGHEKIFLLPSNQPNRMQIFVKMFDGSTRAISVTPSYCISDVKAIIQIREGIPPDKQRFVWSGKDLEDGRTISHYNIEKHNTLHFLFRW